MAYNEFTWAQVKRKFELETVEGARFLPEIAAIPPSSLLQQELERNLPWALTTGNEKARSEGIISPILLEVRDILQRNISVFSGERLDVDPSAGLNGYCDFLISRSPEQVEVEAPVVVIIEAKQENIKAGLGQCAATMIAAQKFNQHYGSRVAKIYGSVSTGTAWRFLQLEGRTLSLDAMDYAVPPADQILGMLTWMVEQG